MQLGSSSDISVEQRLVEIGREMLIFTCGPDAVAFSRMMTSQAINFPDIAKLGKEEGWLKAVATDGALLRSSGGARRARRRRHHHRGRGVSRRRRRPHPPHGDVRNAAGDEGRREADARGDQAVPGRCARTAEPRPEPPPKRPNGDVPPADNSVRRAISPHGGDAASSLTKTKRYGMVLLLSECGPAFSPAPKGLAPLIRSPQMAGTARCGDPRPADAPKGRPRFLYDHPAHRWPRGSSMKTANDATRCWTTLLAIVLSALLIAAPAHAIRRRRASQPRSSMRTDGDAAADQPGGQPRDRALSAGRRSRSARRWRSRKPVHAGATTADISFDGGSGVTGLPGKDPAQRPRSGTTPSTPRPARSSAAKPPCPWPSSIRGSQQPRSARHHQAPPGGCRSRRRARGVGQGHQRRPGARTRPAQFRDRRHQRRRPQGGHPRAAGRRRAANDGPVRKPESAKSH